METKTLECGCIRQTEVRRITGAQVMRDAHQGCSNHKHLTSVRYRVWSGNIWQRIPEPKEFLGEVIV